MKKLFTGFLLLLTGIISYGQEPVKPDAATQSYYLQKSKAKKTLAWILVGAGTIVVVGGIIESESTHRDDGWNFEVVSDASVYVAGGLIAAASIPFFNAAAKFKRKAMGFSGFMRMEKIPFYAGSGGRINAVPSLGLRISIH